MRKDEMTDNKAKWITCPFPMKEAENNFGWGQAGADIQFAPIFDEGGLPMFSKRFKVKGLKKASVDATALGVFDLWINGNRVMNGVTFDEMKPGWSDYDKHVLYYTYDIGRYLIEGENTFLAVLAPGWYAGRIAFGTYKDPVISFMAAIRLEDEDGKREIYTDESWQTFKGGFIRSSDIWDGEYTDFNYPAYGEMSHNKSSREGWLAPGIAEHDIDITPQIGPTIKVRFGLERKPQTVTIFKGTKDNGTDFGEINVIEEYENTDSFTLKKGCNAVIDLGQNMVGWPVFRMNGPKGAQIMVRFGEMLNDSGERSRGNDNPKGSIYSINYRSAKAKLQYVLNGEESASFPRFTFFGFRYLEITANEDVTVRDLTCYVVGSDTEETGRIETSHAKVNQLISNIIWGQRGNYFSVPTDCPQRNERLGWTGDTQIFVGTASYNANVDGFFKKWLRDARDSQSPEGMYPDVIPHVSVVGYGGAAWADAGIVVPYTMMRMYNDLDLVEEHYESMEKYMGWLKSKCMEGPNPHYGDWLAYEPTDSKYICVAYYAYDAFLMAEMSEALGKTERAEYYKELCEKIKAHFRQIYCEPSGELKPENRTQTGYLLAFMIGVFDEENKKKAAKALHDKIVANGHKLSTGFVGAGILNKILAESGDCNLAYSLLLQTDNPSWLYSVDQGATTIWERWNSYTIATGFGDVGMNSFNHYAYGAVEEWMYRYVAGIEVDPEAYGFERVILQPTPDTRTDEELPEGQERITYVKASYDSINGKIVSNWSTEGGFVYETDTAVPARLLLPVLSDKETFTVNGIEHKYADFERKGDRIVIDLAPGRYEFVE